MSHIDVARRHLMEAEQKVNDMTLRERLMIGGTVCLLTIAIWFVTSFEPATKVATQSMTELEAAKARAEEANQNLELQVLALAGGTVQQRRRLEEVQQQVDVLNATLANYASELVDPNEMAIVLEGLLGNRPDLSLVRIRNLPSETLSASEEETATRFYRHGLEIELEGGYAGLVHYLEEIEDLPWRFYWQVLEVETQNYPDNRIRIEVSTLSLNEEWIGA